MWTTHGFWILVTDNRVFDGPVTRHLAAHGDISVIHGFYDPAPYTFSNIVQRLHAARPGFRVLYYTWAGRKPLGGTTMGSVPTLAGMDGEQLSHLLLKNAEGQRIVVTINGRPFILLDPRIAEARTWLRKRVRKVAQDVGSDGVGLDSAIRTPRFLGSIVDPASFPPAFDLMLQGISETTPLTIFNGITPRPDQELLLAFAHGASIEFFGQNDRTNREPTFAANILPYLDAIGRHGDRLFLVFGRASRNPQAYTTYDEDWLWQRYLYCAYLLAAGPNTRWKQHAGFLASPNSGRAGGLDVYADALHDLGPSGGGYTTEAGCYRRAFERGLVLIVPAEATEPTTILIERPMFTPDGTRVFGKHTVAPGVGEVLLRRRPAPPRTLDLRFDPERDPLWRWSELREESGGWHLHLDETPEGKESEHDLALDLVRHRAPRGRLTLWYRTSDPSARIETVVEVDDTGRVKRFALVDSASEMTSDQAPRPAQFRAVAPAVSQFVRLPVVFGGTPMTADGRWHTLAINLEAACAASHRYEFRRAVFARLLGSMDIRRVSLGSRGGITGPGEKAKRSNR
jgi:hypothetical protein